MSNLGQRAREKGEAAGKEIEKLATIKRMYRKGYSIEMIADASDTTPEEEERAMAAPEL